MVKIESISFLLTMVILHFFISVVDARDVYQLDFDDKTKYKHGSLKVEKRKVEVKVVKSSFASSFAQRGSSTNSFSRGSSGFNFSSGEDSSTASSIRDRVNEQIQAGKEREERVLGEVNAPHLVMKTVTISGIEMKQWVMETP